jgi:hypothetical protein
MTIMMDSGSSGIDTASDNGVIGSSVSPVSRIAVAAPLARAVSRIAVTAPYRHLARRNDLVALGGKADMVRDRKSVARDP